MTRDAYLLLPKYAFKAGRLWARPRRAQRARAASRGGRRFFAPVAQRALGEAPAATALSENVAELKAEFEALRRGGASIVQARERLRAARSGKGGGGGGPWTVREYCIGHRDIRHRTLTAVKVLLTAAGTPDGDGDGRHLPCRAYLGKLAISQDAGADSGPRAAPTLASVDVTRGSVVVVRDGGE